MLTWTSWKARLIVLFVISVILLTYLMSTACISPSCVPSTHRIKSIYRTYLDGNIIKNVFSNADVSRYNKIDIENKDVIVFLHIQKTGGSTFGHHLVRNLKVDPPCRCYKHRKRCNCFNSNNKEWIFSRFSVGWVCGLHADWTELNGCVEEWYREKYGNKNRR